MKKTLIAIILLCICLLILASCYDSSEHTGEIKPPASSSALKGQNYEDVVKKFEESGFTNIKLEVIEDLVTGWLTKDGEVEDVSIGGSIDYSTNQWVNCNIEVIIRYHTFPQKDDTDSPSDNSQTDNNTETSILTTENCAELLDILSKKSESDPSYTAFAEKYKGRIVEFDGRIDYIAKHGNYNTRYDILVSAGDYDPNHQTGPIFQFKDVNAYDLDLDTLYLEDKIKVGMNVHIVAKIETFDINSYLFFLDPISVSNR